MTSSKKTRTNADKIRALPDETLADILHKCCISSGCEDCPLANFCGEYRTSGDWFDWLESGAEE